MKNFYLVCVCLLVAAGSVFGQAWVPALNYYSEGRTALGCPCTGGTPFPDGVSVGLYWDNDGNGPDGDDPQPAIGTGIGEVMPQNTVLFNGEAAGEGPGFFVAEFSLSMVQIPETNANYFLSISSGGCCVRSTTFPASPGPAEINPLFSAWTCAAGSCGGTPPTPAHNINASDDTECLAVRVTWQHDGVGVSGFSILRDSEILATVAGTLREQVVPVARDRAGYFRVDAFNASGSAVSADSNLGSTYLMRYSADTRQDLSGSIALGAELDVDFDMPDPPTSCHAGWWLTLWHSTTGPWQRYGIIARDSLSDDGTIVFPEQALGDCRLVLTDSSFDNPLAVFSDTSGLFQLGVAIDDRGYVSPESYGLAQNYPNPFNPTTHIEFSVPTTADVVLEVFNIQGQLVRTLVNTRLNAGVHHVDWDGLTSSGLTASTGLYFYRMVANDFVATQKMLLMK